MAGNDIVLGIAVETKKAVDSLTSFQASATKVFGVVAAAAAAAFAGGALLDGISSVVSAANEQVDAVNKMNQSLVASGDFSKEASKSMTEFASALSLIVAIDDDDILGGLALAKSFGATNEQAKELVKTAADLAATMGTDLNSAVTQLGGTLSGSAGRLGKLSPELKNLSEEALKSGAAIKILGDRFSGAAEAAAGTFSGEIKKAALSFDDLKTAMGLIITQNPAIRIAIKALGDILKATTEIIDDNKKSIGLLISNGFVLLVKSVKIAAVSFSTFATIVQFALKPIVTTIAVLGKGVVTLGFFVKTAVDQVKNMGISAKDAADNADFLFNSFQKLEEIQNFDVSKLADGLSETAFTFADDIENALAGISLDNPIPVSIAPKINPGTVIDFSQARIEFPSPNSADFKLPELSLPQLSPGVPTDAQIAAGQNFEKDKQAAAGAEKTAEEQQAAQASVLVGAMAKGGKEGAIQVLGAVATAVAAAMGAGPFAQVIGEIVTLLTTDGLPKLITSLVENIPLIVETLSFNMPTVALALAEAFLNPLFLVRVVNAFVDGLTKGIDAAFKLLIKQAGDLFSIEIPKAIELAITSGIGQLAIGVVGAVAAIGTGIGNLFIEIGNGIGEYLNKFVSIFDPIVAFFANLTGGAKSAGEKVQDFGTDIKRGAQQPERIFGLGLTGDSGTVQTSSSGFGLTGNSGGGDVSTALLSQILNALNNPISVKSSVQLNGSTLADIMLELSRRNARLTA